MKETDIPQNGLNTEVTKYEFGDFTADLRQKLLLRAGEEIRLPPKTYDLLAFFLANPNRVIPKETLINEVWPDTIVEEANLSVHISTLRRTLAGAGEAEVNVKIETFPKIGYRFSGDVRDAEQNGGAPGISINGLLSEVSTRMVGDETILNGGRRIRSTVGVIGSAVVLIAVAA